MKATKSVPTLGSDAAEKTLKRAPARLLAFLQGAANPAIAASLVTIGWSHPTIDEGWGLLSKMRASNVVPVPWKSNGSTEATAYVEEWQDTGLVRARMMLQRSHPDQAAFLVHGLKRQKGLSAVIDAAAFLARCDMLEEGAGRRETRKADLEALAILEQIGETKAARKRLDRMIAIARTPQIGPNLALTPEQQASQRENLREIYAWVTTWSEMARTVITRRDQRIMLGIAKRRPTKAKGGATESRAA